MSSKDTHDHDDNGKAPHGATTIHATKSGNGAKWVIGALVAALVAGGGYLAWKNMPAGQPSDTQSAANETYSNSASQTAPTSPSAPAAATDSATQDAIAPAPAPARTTTHARRSSTQVASVQEETIGVTPASVNSQSDEGVVVTGHRAVWTRMPSATRLASYYPERALTFDREGEATLHCTVGDGGRLACAKVSETPNGDFGAAALRISRQLRHADQFADGRDAIGRDLNLRVVFRLDDDRHARG